MKKFFSGLTTFILTLIGILTIPITFILFAIYFGLKPDKMKEFNIKLKDYAENKESDNSGVLH